MLMQQYRIVDNEHPVVAFLDIFDKSVDKLVIGNALSDQVPWNIIQ